MSLQGPLNAEDILYSSSFVHERKMGNEKNDSELDPTKRREKEQQQQQCRSMKKKNKKKNASAFHSTSTDLNKRVITAAVFVVLAFSMVLLPALLLFGCLDTSIIIRGPKTKNVHTSQKPLNCSDETAVKETCAANYESSPTKAGESSAACPEYFRWIHEDLRPWKSTGITRENLERAKEHSHFRVVIYKGKAYLEKFRNTYQTRDLFTVYGIVQLLRFYPGMVPDLELLFRCHDTPLVAKKDYQSPNATSPPALFQFCGHNDHLAVIFPDWSYWGWAEVNIEPWNRIMERIKEGSERTKWERRIPYAFWKGVPLTPDRRDVMSCNPSKERDWGVRAYRQDWGKETRQGFKNSRLENQCTHRYKIYVEGFGWSVSEKYILACDSMTLLIKPEFYDFFTRGLVPMQHYWPIRRTNKCKDFKFAVEWGNNHTREAQEIGKGGSGYTQEELKMENVYAYMLHLLTEYSKLLKFKPEIPKGAVELCAEAMACKEQGLWRTYMVDSMVRSPSEAPPCAMPPPYDPASLQAILEKKRAVERQVENWTDTYWAKQ